MIIKLFNASLKDQNLSLIGKILHSTDLDLWYELI